MAKSAAPERKPLRYKLSEAASLLSIHYETLRKLIHRDVFTVIEPNGRGIGKHVYLHPDEVELYALRGPDALREYRVRKGRLKTRK